MAGLLKALVLAVCVAVSLCAPPNIVFVLTDDQDAEVGGQIPVQKTRQMVGDKGIVFSNMFVSSPLCCPSRSSIFTGKYVHNHQAINNSVEGNCSSQYWQSQQEVHAFPVELKKHGYTTFFAGKYLNQYGFPRVGGVEHIPPGWDWWNGLVGNSKYYGYTLSINGTAERHDHNYAKDYLTDVIHRRAMEFLAQQSTGSPPFFMMLSTPACHGPFTPAPQYSNSFSDREAPTGGSFNKHGKNKHWLLEQTITPMPNDTLKSINNIFRNRWRTLLSVDDMVEDVVRTLEAKGLLDSTYVFFSSDNGFHLGQFSLPGDKRQLYEFDVRVPFMVRGPGIQPGQVRKEYVMNIDLAPTFVELVGGGRGADGMDGLSLVPLLTANSPSPVSGWRGSFLTEHSGGGQETVKGCPQYRGQGMEVCNNHCVCEDSWNNTYTCVRVMSNLDDWKYCQFQDDENFVEVYALHDDPSEFHNMRDAADPGLLQTLRNELEELSQCAGQSCQTSTLQSWDQFFRGLRP